MTVTEMRTHVQVAFNEVVHEFTEPPQSSPAAWDQQHRGVSTKPQYQPSLGNIMRGPRCALTVRAIGPGSQ